MVPHSVHVLAALEALENYVRFHLSTAPGVILGTDVDADGLLLVLIEDTHVTVLVPHSIEQYLFGAVSNDASL